MNSLPCRSCCCPPRYEEHFCSAPPAGFSTTARLNQIAPLPRHILIRQHTGQTYFENILECFSRHQHDFLLSRPLIFFSLPTILENLASTIWAKNTNFTISTRDDCACIWHHLCTQVQHRHWTCEMWPPCMYRWDLTQPSQATRSKVGTWHCNNIH